MKSRRLAILLATALFLFLPSSVTAAECQFVLGFKMLRDLIGHDIVGECLEDERYAANGNSEQHTTGGLLVWRKADNWTAFTDGYRTWINGPNGLVQRLNTERFAWEADYAPGGGVAIPASTPEPSPSPESDILVEQAIQSLMNLPIVKREPEIVDGLRRIARVSQPVFWKLLEQSGDNLRSTIEVNYIADIAQVDWETALKVVQMPFMSTPHQGADHEVLRHVSKLTQSDPTGLRQILSHPRLPGGITDDHITTFALLVLGLKHPEAARAIEALPWVQDGVGRRPTSNGVFLNGDPVEREESAVLSLVDTALTLQEVGLALVSKPWLLDG